MHIVINTIILIQEDPTIHSVKYLFCLDISLTTIFTEQNKYEISFSILHRTLGPLIEISTWISSVVSNHVQNSEMFNGVQDVQDVQDISLLCNNGHFSLKFFFCCISCKMINVFIERLLCYVIYFVNG